MENLESKAIEVLDTIAVQLGVGVDHFWPILVRQQVIEGAMSFIPVIVMAVAWIIFLKKLPDIYERSKKAHYERWPGMVWSKNDCIEISFAYPVIFAFSSMAIIVASSNIAKLFNPEYYALKEIMRMF